ncbi:hypothetical protein AFK68_20540 [Hydrocoleum sp. CS-953]|uniref:hypothetical protein n=1 Tax=Hydrocoleum sp. CS-953 TaxID=1671698 RepID=UPI000B9A2666|nr:hypothetical protein [Hydrocoleum sp. CS-953]OZH53019.1 hypothetical protein AFK68_20540 [Hydrocoleum sp. CS-953]
MVDSLFFKKLGFKSLPKKGTLTLDLNRGKDIQPLGSGLPNCQEFAGLSKPATRFYITRNYQFFTRWND